MSYYEKYLKYKLKYLNLAKQLGGDWECPFCTYINKDSSKNCEMCLKNPIEIKKQWQCNTCTFLNPSSSERCEMCDTPRFTKPVKSVHQYEPDVTSVKDRTFYIYTTGIGEWGDLSKAANTWLTILRPVILRNIPKIFNNIIIRHYDPLLDYQDKDLKSKRICEKTGKKI